MDSQLQTFISQWTGKKASYDGVPANAGQCVQLVEEWCKFLGTPVEWQNAAAWWSAYSGSGSFTDYWEQVANNPNDAGQLPSPGDIVVFSGSLPGSGGYGHIDIFVRSTGTNTWVAFDSNWPVNAPAQQNTHNNWDYVLGWFHPKVALGTSTPAPSTPAAAPTPTNSPVAWQGKDLYLPANINHWNIYKVGGPWTTPNAIAALNPSEFGGLTYQILGSPAANIYLIQTSDFGEVAIYAGPDTPAEFKAPAPAAPAGPPFTVETITTKWVQANKNPTNMYNLNANTLDQMAGAPLGTIPLGTIIKGVCAIATHTDGYKYYMTDPGNAQGYNVLDCDDYTPPPTAPAAPAAATAPPAAPVTIPGNKTKYPVLVKVPTYGTLTDALNATKSTGFLIPGQVWYVFTQKNGMYSMTQTPGKSSSTWINPVDNQVPAAPVVPAANAADEAWKSTYKAFPKITEYEALMDLTLIDYAGLDPNGIAIQSGHMIPMHGYFVKNNMTFLMPQISAELSVNKFGKDISKDLFYGVATTDVETGAPNMATEPYITDAEDNRSYRKAQGHLTTEDKIYYAGQKIAQLVNSGVRFLDGIIPLEFKKKNKK